MSLWSELRDSLGPKIVLPDPCHLPRIDQGFLRWIWFFLRPYRTTMALVFVIRIVRSTFFALVMYFFSLLIDALQSGFAFEHPEVIWRNIIMIAIVYFVVMSSYMIMMYESLVLDKASRGLTLFSVQHLLSLPLDWHEQQGSGAKMQRVMQARDALRDIYFLFARNLMPFFGEVIGITIAVVAMHVPPYMLLLFAGYIANYLLVSWGMTRMQDKLQDSHNALKESLVSRVYDFVTHIRLSKIFSLDTYVRERSHEAESAGHAVIRRLRKISYTKWSLMNIVVWFWVGLIVVMGLKQVLGKVITIGAFSAIIFMAHRMWGTLEEVAMMQMDYVDLKSGFLRIRQTLGVASQNYDVQPVVKTPENWTSLDSRAMTFTYNERLSALTDINMTIPRGKRIALVGHSGAGKSTFVKLLMKQILPQQGDIFVGDTALKHIESRDWLRHLALVPQDVEMMNATLRANILLDRTDMSEEFYQDCLHKAYLTDFVASLPEGDLTEIGERGIKLSGGQRQRLGIARALARQAGIIIFDEATSSLDSESEAHIQQAMDKSFGDKTLIVIAHRLSTIRHADHIYVFENGRIAESGTFTELEKDSRIFSKLWAMQSKGFI